MRRWMIGLALAFGLLPGLILAEDKASEELFAPILVNGVVSEFFHYQTRFLFLEVSGTTESSALSVEVEVFDNDGNRVDPSMIFCALPVVPADGVQRFTLPAFGSLLTGTKGFVGIYEPTPGVLDGWVRIRTSGSGKLRATVELLAFGHRLPAGVGCEPVMFVSTPSSHYVSDALIQVEKPATAFRASAVATYLRQTAFSIVNPSDSQTAKVHIDLYDSSGTIIGHGMDLVLAPMHRASAFAREWMDVIDPPGALTPQFYGSARISSDVPIVVGALEMLFPEGKLVSTNVTPEGN